MWESWQLAALALLFELMKSYSVPAYSPASLTWAAAFAAASTEPPEQTELAARATAWEVAVEAALIAELLVCTITCTESAAKSSRQAREGGGACMRVESISRLAGEGSRAPQQVTAQK